MKLQIMQSAGTVASSERVLCLLAFEGHVVVAYRNGVIKAFNPEGVETFSHGPLGHHNTNTAVALMRHPDGGKAILLCGQKLGYVTVYDLPEFRPRGTFSTGYDGDVTAILDLEQNGLFATCGLSGDVILWRWGADELPVAA